MATLIVELNALASAQQAHMASTVTGFETGIEVISKGLQQMLVNSQYMDPVTAKLMTRQLVFLQAQIRAS